MAAVLAGLVSTVPKMPRWQWGEWSAALPPLLPLLALAAGLCLIYSLAGLLIDRKSASRFAIAFGPVFVLALLAYLLANERSVRAYGIGYAFWALGLGMLLSNTLGLPGWLRPAVRTEFYIKTGLVLLGAEILFNNILSFGAYGLAIAWGVTPLVIVFMWLFGTRILRMANRPLVIIIAAATSVCGVSAAIAAAAACRARKEDLTVAVGMTLIFTVLMMIGMPALIEAMGLDPLIGGAWMGGTIDATGAVVAAGAALGSSAEQAAAIVKMIQNLLIGAVAFLIALYWVTVVERRPDAPRPGIGEVWLRFPKFILGFVAASVVTSFLLIPSMGQEAVMKVLDQTKVFRGWLFCLAFVSIGLEANLREMAARMVGGKPVYLYLTGQTFNLILTLLIAWLVLSGVLFPPPPQMGGGGG